MILPVQKPYCICFVFTHRIITLGSEQSPEDILLYNSASPPNRGVVKRYSLRLVKWVEITECQVLL